MKQISDIKEIHSMELKILEFFDSFCKQNNLKYSLGAGTLLGAVRHKGFIPWDDDIDLFMERGYYNKLLKLISKEKKYDRFVFLSPYENDYAYSFIKLVDSKTMATQTGMESSFGLWLDIFPVDFCGNTEKEGFKYQKRFYGYVKKIMRNLNTHEGKDLISALKRFYMFLQKNLFKTNAVYFKNKALSLKFPQFSKYAGTLVWTFSKKDVYPAEYFADGYTELVFETLKCPVFKRYDEILKHRYGDYMKLPPEKDRQVHLGSVVLLD